MAEVKENEAPIEETDEPTKGQRGHPVGWLGELFHHARANPGKWFRRGAPASKHREDIAPGTYGYWGAKPGFIGRVRKIEGKLYVYARYDKPE